MRPTSSSRLRAPGTETVSRLRNEPLVTPSEICGVESEVALRGSLERRPRARRSRSQAPARSAASTEAARRAVSAWERRGRHRRCRRAAFLRAGAGRERRERRERHGGGSVRANRHSRCVGGRRRGRLLEGERYIAVAVVFRQGRGQRSSERRHRGHPVRLHSQLRELGRSANHRARTPSITRASSASRRRGRQEGSSRALLSRHVGLGRYALRRDRQALRGGRGLVASDRVGRSPPCEDRRAKLTRAGRDSAK